MRLTLQELAAEVQRRGEAKADYIADTRKMQVVTEDGVSRVVINGEAPVGPFVVNDHCHDQFAGRLSIPRKFYDRLRQDQPDMLDYNVNELLHRGPERRMLRTLEGWDGQGNDVARAFLSDRYRRLDDDDLAEHLLPVLAEIPDVSVQHCQISEKRLYINVVSPRTQGEVRVGDIVQAGVCISNSEVGSGALKVEPRLFRLACLNGMVVPHAGTRKYHIGRRAEDSDDALRVFSDATLQADDQAFFMKARDIVKAAVSDHTFNLIIQQLRVAADPSTEIQNSPAAAVEVLAQKVKLGDGETASVLTHLSRGGDLTQYGVANAVTRFAQDVEDADRSHELEVIGSDIVDLSPAAWRPVMVAA